MRRVFFCLLLLFSITGSVAAETIRWVDFDVPYESLQYAMEQDIATFEQEKHLSWIDILSLAACRTGGKCGLSSVKKAASDLRGDKGPKEILGENGKYFAHTLNNTVVAPPRMLIAFLENNLNADGSVNIPVALRPYMGGVEKLMPKK